MFQFYERSGIAGSYGNSVLGVHWKEWCWSWNSNTLTTSCEELTHWKRPLCWVWLGAGGEGDDRGWDGWMASPTQWTWVWVDSGRWWWTGRPGLLRFMGLQKVGHNWATELKWTDGSSIFRFWRNLHTLFHSGFTNLHSYQQHRKLPFSLHPHQHKDTCNAMLIAVLLTVPKVWKQPVSINRLMDKDTHTHTYMSVCVCVCIYMYIYTHILEYYAVIKKYKIMLFVATCMHPENIILGEICQRKTNIIWYHFYMESKK